MLAVFYSRNTRDTAMFGMVKFSKSDALTETVNKAVRTAGNYDHVVTFEEDARDLEDVWEAMQAECSSVPRTLRTRSMMVGDLVITSAHEVFVVDSSGFERLDGADVDALLAKMNDAPARSVKFARVPMAEAEAW